MLSQTRLGVLGLVPMFVASLVPMALVIGCYGWMLLGAHAYRMLIGACRCARFTSLAGRGKADTRLRGVQ